MTAAPNILVVDDEPELRDILRDCLTQWGYAVVTCAGGREALAMSERLRFDVVVSDLNMPDGDGEFLVRTLVAGSRNGPPVIMVTAHEARRRDLLDAGAHAVLGKPCDFDQLRHLLAELTRGRGFIRS